jgi:hypothetical protein
VMQREAPSVFGDYDLVELPTGVAEAQTSHKKV